MGHLHGVFLESVSELPRAGEWQLPADEASAKAHLKALRLKNGDQVNLMNGRGRLCTAKILDNRQWGFEALSLETITRPEPQLDVYLSPPKGDDLDRTVQICVELGVKRLVLFKSEHSAHKSALKAGRLNRIAQSSCEQSLNPWLPLIEVDFDKSLPQFLQNAEGQLLVCDEMLAGRAPFYRPSSELSKYSVFVGPEGGWSEREREIFRNKKVQSAALGPVVLKVPTALSVVLGILRSYS